MFFKCRLIKQITGNSHFALSPINGVVVLLLHVIMEVNWTMYCDVAAVDNFLCGLNVSVLYIYYHSLDVGE